MGAVGDDELRRGLAFDYRVLVRRFRVRRTCEEDCPHPVGKMLKTQKKDKASPNYDYTGSDRVARQRKALAGDGGARVEAHLDADDLARLDALIATGVATSRRAALKYLVQQLPAPKIAKKA